MKTKYTYKQIWTIAYPILISLIMEQMIGMTDTAFLGRVGEIELGASAIAGVYYLAIFMMAFGFSIGAQILIARRNGEGNYKEIGPIFYQGIYFLLAVAVILFTLSIVFSPHILRNIISSPHIYDAAESYIHWRVYGFFFSFVMVMFRAFFVGTTQTKTLTLNSIVMVLSNVVFNYILIFGKFGFPELGVEGAAISTAFSRGVSMVILFIILFRKHIHRFPLAYFRPFPWIELRNLMKVGLPSAGEQLSYSSSQVVITFFINMLGVEALATRTYCVNIIMFVYLFSISMAQGGAICIGHLIGEKKPRAAFLLGKYVMKKSVMITFILSCILAVFGHTILSWLTVNPDIIRMGVIVLIIDTVLEIGRPINIFATNALRAAGDVNYPFYVGLIVMWSVAVGGGYLFGVHWAWGLCGMWVAFLLDENIRGIIFVRRWYSMKWVHKSFVQA